MQKPRTDRNKFAKIWESPAVHSKHPGDTAFDRILRRFAFWVQFILDYDQRIRAASLAYFTFFGIVPFCSVFLWFTDSIKTDTEVSSVLATLFPGMKSSFDSIAGFAQNNLARLSSSWAPWVALAIIVYTVFCMFNNIQKIFNAIWRSTSRKMHQQIRTSVFSFLALTAAILLGSYCFHAISNIAVNMVICSLLIFLCLCAAFYFFPFDKKPTLRPILVAAAVTTFLLVLWVFLMPLIDKFVATYQSVGLLSFLLIFWIFVTWLIIVFGAKYCRHLDKSGETYLKEEIENMSPLFRCYLSMIVTSYIFRNTVRNTNGTYSLSFEQIRREMFKAEPGARDVETGELIDNSQVFLPMPLLDQIIDDLCDRCGILLRNSNSSGVSFCPNKSMDGILTYTVGDFLFDYFIAGGNISTFKYEKLHESLEKSLSSGFAGLFATCDSLIVDLKTEKNIEPYDFDALLEEGVEVNVKYETEHRRLFEEKVAQVRAAGNGNERGSSFSDCGDSPTKPQKRSLLSKLFG